MAAVTKLTNVDKGQTPKEGRVSGREVFELADPYIAAASLRESNHGKSLEIAKRIIADRPETDLSVRWAHVMVGRVMIDQHNTGEAIAEYRKAIELDPRDAEHHYDLEIILLEQGKIDEADAEYQKAKELSAKHPD